MCVYCVRKCDAHTTADGSIFMLYFSRNFMERKKNVDFCKWGFFVHTLEISILWYAHLSNELKIGEFFFFFSMSKALICAANDETNKKSSGKIWNFFFFRNFFGQIVKVHFTTTFWPLDWLLIYKQASICTSKIQKIPISFSREPATAIEKQKQFEIFFCNSFYCFGWAQISKHLTNLNEQISGWLLK